MKSRFERAVALICVTVCALGALMPGFIRTGVHGRFTELQLDTNGDGQPDVVEYYRDGALLRRVSDRNFNGVTDLVEDFDEVTQQRVRSIVDQDYDGTADVLLLYRHGQPVVSERASQSESDNARTPVRRDAPALVSLRNPFGDSRAFESSALAVPWETWIGPTAAAGLLVSAASLSAPTRSLNSPARPVRAELTANRTLRSPRGPPLT